MTVQELIDTLKRYTIRYKGGIMMTVAGYTRLIAQIAVLKEIAMAYPTKTIENIIMQMESRKKEIGNSAAKQ